MTSLIDLRFNSSIAFNRFNNFTKIHYLRLYFLDHIFRTGSLTSLSEFNKSLTFRLPTS